MSEGLEATHEMPSGLVLNNIAGGFPRYKLDELTGWDSLAEIIDHREQRYAAPGEWTHPVEVAGLTIMYVGRVQATSRESLRTAIRALKAACRDRNTEGQFTVVGIDETLTFNARIMQMDIDDILDPAINNMNSPAPHQRVFTMGVRLSDARKYETVAVSETGVASVVVNNTGSVNASPLITIAGVAANDTITITMGTRVLKFIDDFGDFNGSDLVIDFRNHTAVQNGTDMTPKLYPYDSNWWDGDTTQDNGIPPGSNTISQTGGTGITVEFYPAH